MSDPRITADFWMKWKEFEIRHGNEDTMREMLRIKRSVQATYNTQVNLMAVQIPLATTSANANSELSKMQQLESKVAEQTFKTNLSNVSNVNNIMFVRGETQGGKGAGKEGKVLNPEEIDIDDDDDEDEEESDEGEEQAVELKNLPIEKQSIPASVFGSLKKTDEDSE